MFKLSDFLEWYNSSIDYRKHIINLVEKKIQSWKEWEENAPFAAQRVEGLLKGDKAKKYKAKLLEELEVEKNRECTLHYFYEYPEERGFKIEPDGEGYALIPTYSPPKTFCTFAKMKACEVEFAEAPKHDGKVPSYIMVDNFV